MIWAHSAPGLSSDVIFMLDALDWLKYLVALFFFLLGLFAGWWRWHYRRVLLRLEEALEAVEQDRLATVDSGRHHHLEPEPQASEATEPDPERGDGGDGPSEAIAVSQVDGEEDDLQRIRGIGSSLKASLNQHGIHRFNQIANWSPADIAEISKQLQLGAQIARFSWVEQAKSLEKAGESTPQTNS